VSGLHMTALYHPFWIPHLSQPPPTSELISQSG
jgi:hypothetical protein